MTLPKGFGSGSRCPKCNERLTWSYNDQESICTNGNCSIGRGERSINIPISKREIGKILFYITFYGGIISIATIGIHTDTGLQVFYILMGSFSVIFSSMFGWVETKYPRGDSRKNKEQLFFIFVPIANIIRRMHLKN